MAFDDHVKRWGVRIAFAAGAITLAGAVLRVLMALAPFATKDAHALTQAKVEQLEKDEAADKALLPVIDKKVDTLGLRMDNIIDTWNRHIEQHEHKPKAKEQP